MLELYEQVELPLDLRLVANAFGPRLFGHRQQLAQVIRKRLARFCIRGCHMGVKAHGDLPGLDLAARETALGRDASDTAFLVAAMLFTALFKYAPVIAASAKTKAMTFSSRLTSVR